MWPTSNVIKLFCVDTTSGTDSYCACKAGWMDADNDPQTGCELFVDDAVCEYGSCAEHGVSNDGDFCGAWNGNIQVFTFI